MYSYVRDSFVSADTFFPNTFKFLKIDVHWEDLEWILEELPRQFDTFNFYFI